MYRPIKVPVLPSPALQWTATAYPPYLISYSHIFINLDTISSEGHDPSKNSKSCTLIPFYSNISSLYKLSFNLITVFILYFKNLSVKCYGGSPSLALSVGDDKAKSFLGIIQFISPFSNLWLNSYSL
jgi:hypothetical protein